MHTTYYSQRKRQSCEHLAQEVRISLKTLSGYTYNCTEEHQGILIDLNEKLQKLTQEFKSKLPQQDGLLLRPQVRKQLMLSLQKKVSKGTTPFAPCSTCPLTPHMSSIAYRRPLVQKRIPVSTTFRKQRGDVLGLSQGILFCTPYPYCPSYPTVPSRMHWDCPKASQSVHHIPIVPQYQVGCTGIVPRCPRLYTISLLSILSHCTK